MIRVFWQHPLMFHLFCKNRKYFKIFTLEMLSHIISIDRKQSKCLILKKKGRELLQQTGQCHKRKKTCYNNRKEKNTVQIQYKSFSCLRSVTDIFYNQWLWPSYAPLRCAHHSFQAQYNTYKGGAASQLLCPTAKAPQDVCLFDYGRCLAERSYTIKNIHTYMHTVQGADMTNLILIHKVQNNKGLIQ